jgi:uncharacterized protein
MSVVVLDTNALLFPFQFKVSIEEKIIDLIGGCKILVPSVVNYELKLLAARGVGGAAAAIRYAERFEILDCDPDLSGDTAILEASMKVNGILVTSDRGLIARAKEAGLKVIFLRGKQKLELK